MGGDAWPKLPWCRTPRSAGLCRDYLVEQQAYYRTDGPRITWMRVLCSGYQPLPAEARLPVLS